MFGKRENNYSKSAIISNVLKRRAKPFMYFSVRQRDRQTPVKPNEIAQRRKFSAVMAATMARLKNPEYIAADMAAFSNQEKYVSLRGFVFHLEWVSYTEQHD